MLLFGHLGISLALIFLADIALQKLAKLNIHVDYRYVLLGAVLPDIIDKLIGRIFFYDIFHGGRIFSHTLLFSIALALLALLLNKVYRQTGFGFIAIGTFMHIFEDRMWLRPGTFFWPLLSLSKQPRPAMFGTPKTEISGYTSYLLDNLLTDPGTFSLEILGFSVIAAFAYHYKLYEFNRLKLFILNGELKV